jgi:hypothetical protein
LIALQVTVPKLLWFAVSIGLAWGVNEWRQSAAKAVLQDARQGDRDAAEDSVERALRESQCEIHEARSYLASASTRRYLRRPDYTETFVEKLYEEGAPKIEICDSDAPGFRFAQYLVVTLPDDPARQERVVADAQSFVRREAVVYRDVSSAEVEEIVRDSTLVGTRRVLVDLPAPEE